MSHHSYSFRYCMQHSNTLLCFSCPQQCTYCKCGSFISGFPSPHVSGRRLRGAHGKWVVLQRDLDDGDGHGLQSVLHLTNLCMYNVQDGRCTEVVNYSRLRGLTHFHGKLTSVPLGSVASASQHWIVCNFQLPQKSLSSKLQSLQGLLIFKLCRLVERGIKV